MVEESAEGTDGRGDDAAIERMLTQIREIVLQARTTWFTLLFLLTFAGITLLGVEHADFYAFGRQTQLPLVGVSIPTTSFFWAAPALVLALYVYLHLQLIQLWAALAGPGARPYGQRLGRVVQPGLIPDFGLRLRGDDSAEPHGLGWLNRLVVFALVWGFAPFVLAAFWWGSMAARDEWLTLFLWLLLVAAVAVGRASLARALALAPARPPQRRLRLMLATAAVAALLMTGLMSWTRTEGGLDHYADWAIQRWNANVGEKRRWLANDDDRRRWIAEAWFIPKALFRRDVGALSPLRLVALAPVDVAGELLVERPADWLDHDAAREAFFDDWCAQKRPLGLCESADDQQGEAFAEDWAVRREAMLANLDPLDLSGRDLREGDLGEAFLPAANLREARLEGADLENARLEGADLENARLEGADLRGAAGLEGAVLREARLGGADLRGARLEGAVLSAADFTGTMLNQGQIDGAIGDADTVLPRAAETGRGCTSGRAGRSRRRRSTGPWRFGRNGRMSSSATAGSATADRGRRSRGRRRSPRRHRRTAA